MVKEQKIHIGNGNMVWRVGLATAMGDGPRLDTVGDKPSLKLAERAIDGSSHVFSDKATSKFLYQDQYLPGQPYLARLTNSQASKQKSHDNQACLPCPAKVFMPDNSPPIYAADELLRKEVKQKSVEK